jgi:hypothetical protein
MAKYKRGFTAKERHPPDERPPKVSLNKRVINDWTPDRARSATMPPPTGDTEEPRQSRRLGRTSRR